MAWDSSRNGTLWLHRQRPRKKRRQITEAEDNAIGRAIRRREHRHARGWLPFAKR